MANWIQRLIYNMGNAVPLAVLTALAWYYQNRTWLVPIVLLGVAICIVIVTIVCFRYARNNCSVKQINVSSISSRDSWVVVYILTYMFPFATLAINDFNIILLIVVVLTLLLTIGQATMAVPSMLLFFCGYHFYKIEVIGTGVADYLLISKRKRIRSNESIKTVQRVFEKLLVDTERRD